MKDRIPFFIGVGGSGMSAIANILLDLKITVYGYDKNKSPVIEKLIERGLIYSSNVDEINLDKIDYAIYSSAVKETHPVFQFFKENNIVLVHRSEILHQIFSSKISIAVAGSHGKTSTTTMFGQILYDSGIDPAIMVGGEVLYLEGKGGRWGRGKIGVYESDESDGTFLNHRANLKIVTNVDNDHLDYYKTESKLYEAFAEFIYNNEKTKSFVYLGDEGVQKSISLLDKKLNLVCILEESKEIELEENFLQNNNIIPFKIEHDILYFNEADEIKKLILPLKGDHYLRNAFLAYQVAREFGLESDLVLSILKNYQGVKRRLEFLGKLNGIQVYDDYGHHPTEISAVIQSIKKMRKFDEKSCILFQPHRFTRTRDHYKEFAESLENASLVFLLPIYSAGEEEISGISSEIIYNEFIDKSKVVLLSGNKKEDLELIDKYLFDNDFLVTLGAGNVREWGEEFLKQSL